MTKAELQKLADEATNKHWPALTPNQREVISTKLVQTWNNGEPGVLLDGELLFVLKSYEVETPAMFRAPPSPAETKAHLLLNVRDPQARVEISRRVNAMSPDNRLAAVPADSFIYAQEQTREVARLTPPLTPTMSDDDCFAIIATRMGLLPHEVQRLSAITRLKYLTAFRQALPKAPTTPVTDEAIRKGAKVYADLAPQARIAAFRESQQKGVTAPGLKVGETPSVERMHATDRLRAYRAKKEGK